MDRYRVFREDFELDSEKLGPASIESLDSETRRMLLRMAARRKIYASEAAEKLDCSKQKVFYHFEKLKEAGLLETAGERKKSGGTAKLYEASSEALIFDTGSEGAESYIPDPPEKMREFFREALDGKRLDLRVVPGSAEPHGEHDVRATDGHLAAEISAKLSELGELNSPFTMLDTEVVARGMEDDNLVLLGGPLTNSLTRRFNDSLPVRFDLNSFPYHSLESFSRGEVGTVQKISNPADEEKFIVSVAGVRLPGTRAAVRAFRDLDNLVEDYSGGEFSALVRGVDSDGDGVVDGYEVIER